jgi:hypothetical protein
MFFHVFWCSCCMCTIALRKINLLFNHFISDMKWNKLKLAKAFSLMVELENFISLSLKLLSFWTNFRQLKWIVNRGGQSIGKILHWSGLLCLPTFSEWEGHRLHGFHGAAVHGQVYTYVYCLYDRREPETWSGIGAIPMPIRLVNENLLGCLGKSYKILQRVRAELDK